MRTDVTDEEVKKYQEEGFLIYRNFLNEQEVADLKNAMLEAIDSMGKQRVAGGNTAWDMDDKYYNNVYTQKLNLWCISDKVKSYLHNPALGKLMARLEGINKIRVWHDQSLTKEPFGNPTSLHNDVPYWPFYTKNAITIWIALEDATAKNGCLCFLPGSHRLVEWDNAAPGDEFGTMVRIYPQLAKLEPVVSELKAGDCSFHNGITAHGAGVNMTQSRRLAMTCAYMPDDVTYNGIPNILPESYVKRLKVGDKLDDYNFNPIIYSE